MSTIDAIGYLRSDVSGIRQEWNEIQIRSLAKRFGYNLRKTVVFSERTVDPLARLMLVVGNLGVDAVITPGVAHFGADVPGELVQLADVITVDPEETYARWAALGTDQGAGRR